MIKPRTMSGTMELLPGEQAGFQRMLDAIRRGYESFGFAQIETPAIELAEVLLTKGGGDTERQVYFVQSSGSVDRERVARATAEPMAAGVHGPATGVTSVDPGASMNPELALRFDLTVPLARYVAEHERDLVFPFRRYQIQRVYRGESAQRGRFREFYQCDVDVVGQGSLSVAHDAEMPAVVAGVLRGLAVGPFTVGVSNRKVLSGLLEDLGVVDRERVALVLREVDKLDKRGAASVKEALMRPPVALHEGDADRLLDFLAIGGSKDDVLRAITARRSSSERYRTGVAELAAVVERIGYHGVADDDYAVDLSIARGLDYYTGTVYETRLDEHPGIGSVCSGGRYDDLAGHYTTSRLPGVGVSIGATRLYDQLRSIGYAPAIGHAVDVVVTVLDVEHARACAAVAGELRSAGLRVILVHEEWKARKQLQYVARVGAPVAVLYAGSEAERGVVSVKDMRTGEQSEAQRSGIVAHVVALLGRRGAGLESP